MLNCIAIDDEPGALEIIKKFCEHISFIKLQQCFTQVSLAQRYLKNYPVDLIFLDIQMPDVNGIEFIKTVKQKVMVIFVSAYSEYAIEGFNLAAVDYLLKPIVFDRFELACKRAIEYHDFLQSSTETEQRFLYVRSSYNLVKIPYEDIVYCETMDDYVIIHRTNDKPVKVLMSLKKMQNQLPEDEFARVHRSYIVNISKVNSVRGNTLFIDETEISMGSSYKKDFYKKYKT